MYEFEILFVGKSDAEMFRTADYDITGDNWLCLDGQRVNLANVLWYSIVYVEVDR